MMSYRFCLTLILLFSSFASFGQSCDYKASEICTNSRADYRDKELRILNEKAFADILSDNAMEDLICKNFDRKNGEFVYDFLWNRDCWDWRNRRTVKKLKIKSCEDFIPYGATKNFLLNCYQLIDKKLVNDYYSSLHFKTQTMIENVKRKMLNAFDGENYQSVVERNLRSVVNATHLEMNLSKFKSKFYPVRDICEKVDDYNFCHHIKNSEKKFLSFGAHAFYGPGDLELFTALKFSEYLVDAIKYYESVNLQQVYFEIFQGNVSQWKLENILARSLSSDLINRQTLVSMIMSRYFKANNNVEYFEEFKSLDQICINKSSTEKEKSDYYYEDFNELHSQDRIELMLCK